MSELRAVQLRALAFSGALLLAAVSLAALLLRGGRAPRSAASPVSPASREQPAVLARERAHALPAVSTLLEQPTSAYHARLFADEEGAVLVTQTGFAVFRGAAPAEEHSVPLGPVAVRQGETIVFWRAGWLRQIALSGGSEHRLISLPRPPQYLLASESRLAWIDLDRDAGASVETLSGNQARRVHASEDRVCASLLRGAVVYSVLQSRDGSWRVGSVSLDGQHQSLTPARSGRPPAMLALGPDGVYFYDGPDRGIRRWSFDLAREDAVLANVICSPIAVSDRAICAQVGGLFDLPPGGNGPRFLASERQGPVTALAATGRQLFWVAESGNDRLVVRSAPLPAL